MFIFQARYWAFLFENLRRAVDDLYRTCESDENIPATKEVILVFENYVRDFRNLADWLRLKWEYERCAGAIEKQIACARKMRVCILRKAYRVTFLGYPAARKPLACA